jgi:hypothetical protein
MSPVVNGVESLYRAGTVSMLLTNVYATNSSAAVCPTFHRATWQDTSAHNVCACVFWYSLPLRPFLSLYVRACTCMCVCRLLFLHADSLRSFVPASTSQSQTACNSVRINRCTSMHFFNYNMPYAIKQTLIRLPELSWDSLQAKWGHVKRSMRKDI